MAEAIIGRTCPRCGRPYKRECLPCKNLHAAVYRAANPEKVRAATERWRAANPVKTCSKCCTEYVSDRPYCGPCRKAYGAAWYELNKVELRAKAALRVRDRDKERARHARYVAENRDKELARGVAYRAANREKVKAANEAWFAKNPGARTIYAQNRRALEINGGELSKSLADSLLKLQKGRCACCRAGLRKTGFHLDHIEPLSKGGAHKDWNIQLLCPPCNRSKSAKLPHEFMQARGFLL